MRKTKTFATRWLRIIKHAAQYLLTGDRYYIPEIQHYYYMKAFK